MFTDAEPRPLPARGACFLSQAAPAPRRAPSAFAGPAATNGLDADIPHLAQPPGAAPLRGAAAALDVLADARRAADDWRAAIRAQGYVVDAFGPVTAAVGEAAQVRSVDIFFARVPSPERRRA